MLPFHKELFVWVLAPFVETNDENRCDSLNDCIAVIVVIDNDAIIDAWRR